MTAKNADPMRQAMALLNVDRPGDVPAAVIKLRQALDTPPLVLTLAIDRTTGQVLPVANVKGKEDIEILLAALPAIEGEYKRLLLQAEREAIRAEVEKG